MNPSNYNMTIPQSWELAGVEKQIFKLTHIIGGSGTDTQINCLCVFQKLDDAHHKQAKNLFGK